MLKTIGRVCIFAGAAVLMYGTDVPEIDANIGGSALMLLSGAVLVLRGRKK